MGAERGHDASPPSGAWVGIVPRGGGACLLAVVALSSLFLLASVGRSGIWDPPELDRAELGRRIAIHLFGARELGIDGAQNALPTLSDLGAGELPFTSMAFGFATFGLHDWAGRLPLALWALGGALALFALLGRIVSPRAGLYAAAVLVTMPLYFMQARTMLGDAVTMASFTFAFAGLCGAMLDGRSLAGTLAWLALAALGLVSGYMCRGAIIGVAAPLGGVGLAWVVVAMSPWGALVLPRNAKQARTAISGGGGHGVAAAIGLAALAGAATFAQRGASALADLEWGEQELVRVLGFAIAPSPPVESTFELGVRDLGHSLFPWSSLLPFAIVRVLAVPPGPLVDRRAQEAALRVLLVVGASAAYVAHLVIAPYAGALPFSAPALLAAVVALALVDLERGSSAGPVVGIGTCVVTALLLADFKKLPSKGLVAFGVVDASFPPAFEDTAERIVGAAALVFGVVLVLGWLDPPRSDGERTEGRWRALYARYRTALTELNLVWKGYLVFGFLVVEAACIGMAAMIVVGRWMSWSKVTSMPGLIARIGINAWWALPFVVLATPIAFDLARMGFASAVRVLGLERSSAMVLAGTVASGLLCFGYYPELADRLSPKDAFEAFAARHREGEPLGLMGLKPRVARYYSDGERVTSLAGASSALSWVTGVDRDKQGQVGGTQVGGTQVERTQVERTERRWLLLRRQDLAGLNSLARKKSGENLAVVYGQGQILLASSELGADVDDNPLAHLVVSRPPDVIQHALQARFEDQLEALGWEVTDEKGRLVEWVVPGQSYRMRFFYRALAPMGRDYQAFVHIDGHKLRHNGDHAVLEGEYRPSLWQPGDVLVDGYDLTLEPNFLPGEYRVYFGLCSPCRDDSGRLAVSHGPHHNNRVDGGPIVVR